MGEAMGLRRWLLALAVVALWPTLARAVPNTQGWCESGAQYVTINGLLSTTQVQASFPSCLVTVYVHGGGLATIYSSATFAPLANPFTSSTNGQWQFYAANGRYDIQLSGGGLATPITYSDVVLVDNTYDINNLIYLDGVLYPYTAAGINQADNALGTSAGTIVLTLPQAYCDAVVVLGNTHVLSFSPGLYQLNYAGSDSSSSNVTWGLNGAGPNQTIVQSCPGTNLDVITDRNFASLTGSSNNYGVFRPFITNLKIDGNSSTQTSSGYCIRLYGRAINISNVIAVNCYNDGIYGEYGGALAVTTEQQDIDALIANTKIITAGGNGITNKGAFRLINGIDITGTTGWGIDTFSSIEVLHNANIYTGSATTGAIKTETGGAIVKADGSFSGGKWGVYIGASAAGPMDFNGSIAAASSISGSACIEVHSSGIVWEGIASNCQQGIVTSSASSFNHFKGFISSPGTTGINFSAGDGGLSTFDLTMGLGSGVTDYTGAYSLTDRIHIIPSGGTNHGYTQQYPSGTFTMGANNNTVTVPTGTLGAFPENVLTSGNPADSVIQYIETGAGCATGTSVGNSCTTSLTWGHAFADTNYIAQCTPISVTSGAGTVAITTKSTTGLVITTTNVISGTAAQYGAFDCQGIHY
jgi:hypothetical protein